MRLPAGGVPDGGFTEDLSHEPLFTVPQQQVRKLLDRPLQGHRASCPTGLQVDLFHDMLQAVLSPEDFAKCKDLLMCHPKKDDKTLFVSRSWPTRSKSKTSFKNKLTITVIRFSRLRLSLSNTKQTCLISACRSEPSSFRLKRSGSKWCIASCPPVLAPLHALLMASSATGTLGSGVDPIESEDEA